MVQDQAGTKQKFSNAIHGKKLSYKRLVSGIRIHFEFVEAATQRLNDGYY